MEGDAEPGEVKPKRAPGKDTQIREKDQARINKAESDEDAARADAKAATDRAWTALEDRAKAGERGATTWARAAGVVFIAFAAENLMIFGMTAMGIELPGGIGLSLSKAPVTVSAPNIEIRNEAAELPSLPGEEE
jgi:hypothetical protein